MTDRQGQEDRPEGDGHGEGDDDDTGMSDPLDLHPVRFVSVDATRQ
ncbi:MAG: hypothetical protein ACFCVK_10015 [Acidimicrobiales bacterium]